MPKTSTPSIISEVAIGRRIKGSEMLIGDRLLVYQRLVGGSGGSDGRGGCHPVGAEGARGVTRAPLVSRYWPSTTTRSPAANPFVTTAMPSWIEATSTARRSTVLSGFIM